MSEIEKINRKEVENYLKSQDTKPIESTTKHKLIRTNKIEQHIPHAMSTRSRSTDVNTSELSPKSTVAKNVENATKRRLVRKIKISRANQLMPNLYRYRLVWAHMKGFPFWPGVVEDMLPNGKYLIHFFGDYSYGHVTRPVEEAKYFLFRKFQF